MINPIKTRILFLLSDERMGGVKTSLHSLIDSRLAEQFEFAIAPLTSAKASLSNWHPQIIIVHDACSWKILPNLIALKFMLKFSKSKAKLVIQDHHYSENFERYQVPSPSRFRLMLRLCHWCSDRLLAVSWGQAAWIKKYELVSPHKLTVIQQSLNCDRFFAIPLKSIQKPLTLAAYGRFHEQKGLDILLKAVQLLPDLDFHLKIAGYGADEQKLKQLAAGNPKVEFVGKITDVPAFLADCDGVIIPSRWEPWGNVCLEAKAAGKPVIITAVDGLVEQVNDCGLVVASPNPESLAQAIKSMNAMSPEQLQAWGIKGRASVKNAWNDHLEAWEAMLFDIELLKTYTHVKN